MNILSKDDEIKQLITDCIAHKRKAQYKLFKIFFSNMLNVCLRYASDHAEAEDMLNEGFVKVFANLHKYENKSSLESWMKRVMANNAIDYQRKHKTLIETVNYDEVTETKVIKTDYNHAIDKISYEELLACIQHLPPVSKNVFNLYVFDDYSHSEIAEMLNMKEGTSHWHLNFARNKLKKMILDLQHHSVPSK